jgi:hypothetical protein
MTATRCSVGDLAVVVSANHQCNLGLIVKVIAVHDGKGDLVYGAGAGPVWLVESAQPMTWNVKSRRFRRKRGPVPDCQLEPIRPLRAQEKAAPSNCFSTATA